MVLEVRGDEARTITLDYYFLDLSAVFAPLSLKLTSDSSFTRCTWTEEVELVYYGFDH